MGSRDSRGEASKQINCFDFPLECLEHRRTPLFIQLLGVTIRLKRSTITMERSIVDHFENIAAVGSSKEGPDDPVDKHYKNTWIYAPWIAIGRSRCAPRAFHQSRYNSFNLSTWADVIRWTLSSHDPHTDFQRALDPTPLPAPRVLHLKTTRRELKERDRFIICDGIVGLIILFR